MSACKYVSSDQPRILLGRHREDCADRWSDDPHGCVGCLPCSEPHCRICRRAHADGTCAECLAATREALHDIGRMCDALPEEVEHRGIEGEAMMLLGPAADWEARGHLEASVRAGRVPLEYLEIADGEQHPLFVLGGWDAVWRDALDHDEPTERVTVATAIDYLDRQLGYMADYPHVPFEDFARDVRRCSAHLEAVLHDGEQRDTGVDCLTCGRALERIWKGTSLPWGEPFAPKAPHDGWACRRCRRISTQAQYDQAVKADYINAAQWLTAEDMVIRVPGVKASTVRSWASDKRERPALVRKTLRAERVVYSVEDVQRERARVA